MTVLKSEEILVNSDKSWEDAVESAVQRFSKTVRNVRSANINNLSCTVKDGKVASWRANVQVTFEVE
jgi:flavin-binding protein dodecin